jgi:hypothetical protein
LSSGYASQKPTSHAFEICAHGVFADMHIFGYGYAQNLIAAHCGIVLLTAVAAGDEHIAAWIGHEQAMQAEAVVCFHQNNVSSAQGRLGRGLYVNRLPVANRGRHAGSAGLKANAQAGLQAFQAEGFELPGLRTVFAGANFFRANFYRASSTRDVSARKIRTRAISHGS